MVSLRSLVIWRCSNYPQNPVADLFLIIFNISIDKPDSIGHGTEGYYFAENLQYSLLEVATVIAEELAAQGVIPTAETSAFTIEESEKYFGVCFIPTCIVKKGY